MATNQMSTKTSANPNKKGSKIVHFISFIGGVVFVTSVVGITVYNNQTIRDEIEKQLKALLETTRDAIIQVMTVIEKVNEINRLLKPEVPDKQEPVNSNPEQKALPGENYDSSWDKLEAALGK